MIRTAQQTLLSVALIALFPLAGPAAAQATGDGCTVAAAAKPKKKGLGLGGLLGAARRAGVGDMLGAGMLGDSRAAQVAGAVANVAAEAAAGGQQVAAGARPCAAAPREWRAKN